jgi:hypothetical protein
MFGANRYIQPIDGKPLTTELFVSDLRVVFMRSVLLAQIIEHFAAQLLQHDHFIPL